MSNLKNNAKIIISKKCSLLQIVFPHFDSQLTNNVLSVCVLIVYFILQCAVTENQTYCLKSTEGLNISKCTAESWMGLAKQFNSKDNVKL